MFCTVSQSSSVAWTFPCPEWKRSDNSNFIGCLHLPVSLRLSLSPTALPLSGVTFQINYMNSDPCLGVSCWKISTYKHQKPEIALVFHLFLFCLVGFVFLLPLPSNEICPGLKYMKNSQHSLKWPPLWYSDNSIFTIRCWNCCPLA